MTIFVIRRRSIRKSFLVLLITLVPIVVTSIRRSKFLVRNRAQMIFDLVHVSGIEAPVVVAEVVERSEAVTLNPAGHVDVGVEVAPDQLSQIAKPRLPPVQAEVARAANRSPQSRLPENKDYVIEQINRFEIE